MTDANPYPGPRPFERSQQNLFFGRKRETRDISSLIIANQSFLLYGKSGTGKTSLMQAAIIPRLLSDRRVGAVFYAQGFIDSSYPQSQATNDENKPSAYMMNAYEAWNENLDKPGFDFKQNLTENVQKLARQYENQIIVLVFDQFEEFFTKLQQYGAQREYFFRGVAATINDNPYVRVVFSMREDYIGDLYRYSHLLPDNINARFQLLHLTPAKARQAIEEPVNRLTSREYEPEAVDELVKRVQNRRVTNFESETGLVEAVILQIVCRNLWQSIANKEQKTITLADVEEHAQVTDALKQYFENCLTETVKETNQAVNYEQLLKWFKEKLITPNRTRGNVVRDDDKQDAGGLSANVLEVLENQRIIRGIERANSHWYEVSHDQFVEPILEVYDSFTKIQQQEKLEEQRALVERYTKLLQTVAKRLMISLGILAIVIVILIISFVLFSINQYNTIVDEWQDEIAALVSTGFNFQTATILAADGTTIAELTGEAGQRTIVEIGSGEVSPFFIHAIISSEDPGFYENPGFDVLAIGRVFWQNFFAGEIETGASPITQQIVRERILGSNVVTFDRELTEFLLSMEMERTYSKTQLLDIYINETFYGEQSYGVEAAAQFYFDTSAAELNTAQSAMLAGILPSPSDSNPVVAPFFAFNNMRTVLYQMVEFDCLNFQHGEWAVNSEAFCFSTVTTDDNGNQVQLFTLNPDRTFGGLLALQIAEVETRRYEPRQSDIQYPHFVTFVLGELDAAYGRGAYIERGFTVQTTLIPRIQNTSEIALRQGVDALELNGVQTGAAIVIDPRTGAIVAMVGSPDFNDEEIDGQNNNTISYQQPGSAIKPVVYATALRANGDANYLTPASILWDVRTTIYR